MTSFSKDCDHIRIVIDAVRQDVTLPIARPVGWHDRWGDPELGGGRIPFYLADGFRTYPQMARDTVRSFLRTLHRHTIGRLGA